MEWLLETIEGVVAAAAGAVLGLGLGALLASVEVIGPSLSPGEGRMGSAWAVGGALGGLLAWSLRRSDEEERR